MVHGVAMERTTSSPQCRRNRPHLLYISPNILYILCMSVGSNPGSARSLFGLDTPRFRRLEWESLADIRSINSYLLGICTLLGAACAALSFALWHTVHRSPPVITQDEGYLQWRTTDVLRLRPHMVGAYLDAVVGRLLSVSPRTSDIRPLADFDVAPEILDAFSGVAEHAGAVRIDRDVRQTYRILELRRTEDPRYPATIACILRAEQTVFAEVRGASNTSAYLPHSAIVFHIAYLDRRRPRPENPWGLALVGIASLEPGLGAARWEAAKPLGEEEIR